MQAEYSNVSSKDKCHLRLETTWNFQAIQNICTAYKPQVSHSSEYPSLVSNDFEAVKSLHYPNNMSIKGGILYRLQRFVGGGHSFVKAVLWTSS